MAIPTSNLVTYYTADNISGNTMYDEQGNHDATLYNSPGTLPGRVGDGLNLSTNSMYTHCGTSRIIDLSNPFTLSFWIYPHNYASTQLLVFDILDPGVAGLYWLDYYGQFAISCRGRYNWWFAHTNFPLNQWNHFILKFTGTALSDWNNASKVTIKANNVAVSKSPSGNGGGSSSKTIFGGDSGLTLPMGIDQIRFYSMATTDEEDTSLFEEGAELITELEDASLYLSAYYQVLEDLKAALEATDGTAFVDLKTALTAAGIQTEDLLTWFSSYYQAMDDDAKTYLTTLAKEDRDLALWLAAYAVGRSDLKTLLALAKDRIDSAMMYLSAVSSMLTANLAMYLAVTQGDIPVDMRMFLCAMRPKSSATSILAQRVTAVVRELS